MKNNSSPTSRDRDLAKMVFSHSNSCITNVAAFWWPSNSVPRRADGATMANVALLGSGGSELRAGIIRTPNGQQSISLKYATSNHRAYVMPTPLPKDDSVYFEIDVDPRNSQVIFWVNDRGLDMGILPGFKGGARQALWESGAMAGTHMLSGRFTDCAYATKDGWAASDFHRSDIGHYNLKDHHQVEILSKSSVAINDLRSIV